MNGLKKREFAKKIASKKALEFVKEGMTIGLGTGSTVNHFICALGAKCRDGFKILALPSSLSSFNLAKEEKIPLIEDKDITALDVTIDGADEIDLEKKMIKGRGGALLREKILANLSHEMLVVVDESKCVEKLGSCLLPVEIIPFGFQGTLKMLSLMGYHGQLRKKKESGEIFMTDNGNFVVDLSLPYPFQDPEREDVQLRKIPGVLETGLFLDMCGRVIIGYFDGHVEVRNSFEEGKS